MYPLTIAAVEEVMALGIARIQAGVVGRRERAVRSPLCLEHEAAHLNRQQISCKAYTKIILKLSKTRTVLTRRVSSYGLPAWVSSELGPMGGDNLYNVRSSIGSGSLLRARFTNRDLT